MKKSTKASLLSALVFPGMGQLFLKRYLSAIALIGASGAVLYLLMNKAITQSMDIIEQIQSGQASLELSSISNLLAEQSGNSSTLLTMAPNLLLGLWLIGIIHAYLVGRKQDS